MGATPSATGYIDHPAFHEPEAQRVLFPPGEPLPPLPPVVHLVVDDFRQRPRVQHLPADEERRRFLQYNYARLRAGLPGRTRTRWAATADHLREYLTRRNMALVAHSMHLRPNTLFDRNPDEAFSEGAAALARAVDKFNVGKGWKFSTYAIQCILNALTSLSQKLARQRDRLPTQPLCDRLHGNLPEEASGDGGSEMLVRLRKVMESNAAGLTDAEAAIVGWRFCEGPPLPFAQCGERLGYSNQWARLLLASAMKKLRAHLVADAAA